MADSENSTHNVLRPRVAGFFDEDTNTVSYVVSDSASGEAVIIDPVLDYDAASGRTSTAAADRLVAYVRAEELAVQRILETHAHADHLTSAPYLKSVLGGRIGIGANIRSVQKTWSGIFNLTGDLKTDGSQFDDLFADGETFSVGSLTVRVMETPGHTPACICYVVGDAAFVGDTMFMPDYGSARVDFPGGDARTLYRSIQRILALPDDTRLFMCHDYKAPGRDEYVWETTVAQEKAHNIHFGAGISEDGFAAMRIERDRTLSMPRLLLPSIQVNIRAGNRPPAESNGVSYLKIPLDSL
ncbi:MAG: MBL fold metallo-hydrolase [Alphaproteobacteria bacterium]